MGVAHYVARFCYNPLKSVSAVRSQAFASALVQPVRSAEPFHGRPLRLCDDGVNFRKRHRPCLRRDSPPGVLPVPPRLSDESVARRPQKIERSHAVNHPTHHTSHSLFDSLDRTATQLTNSRACRNGMSGSARGGAEHLARIHGTEEDKVRCDPSYCR